MDPITEQITGATRLALDARQIHETITEEGLRHLEATTRLRPTLGMGALGAPRDMALAITEEDELLDATEADHHRDEQRDPGPLDDSDHHCPFCRRTRFF